MNPIHTTNKWNAFPATYRAEAVADILHWIALGESGVVVGGSGTGKSNIAGYLVNRPDVTSRLLPEPLENYCFLLFDFNGLPVITTANFYRSLLYTLEEACTSDPDLQSAMQVILQRVTHQEDILAIYLALQRAHQLLIERAGKQVIWLFDYFDKGCTRLDADALNSLRNLRDQFKAHLSYLAFTRAPLARLRNPAEYDEFHEIMVMHTCWVGAMTADDGQWVAQQVETRYRKTLPPAKLHQIFDLCGGLPAFLLTAYSALAEGALAAGDEAPQVQEKLLKWPAFQRNCQEIWDSYTTAEQAILRLIAVQGEQAKVRAEDTHYLQQMGLLTPTISGRWQIFAPVFGEFIRRQQQSGMRGIVVRNGAVYRDGVLLPDELTALEYRLLEYLCQHAGEDLCKREHLEDYLWPEDYGRGYSDRLTALVKRLRRKIETEDDWTYIQTVHGRGYKFQQPPT